MLRPFLTLWNTTGGGARRKALLLRPLALLSLLLAGLGSCVDLDFDEPPIPGLPELKANKTIMELKALHKEGDNDQLIGDDIIIRGLVIAEDQSGNFFKSIVIQDESGGIELRLNSVGLYNTFPVGREVFVQVKGLYLGDYNGIHQLNGSPEAALEEALIARHVIGGKREQPLKVDTFSIDKLGPAQVSTLVHIRDLQFSPADTSATFADAVAKQTANRNLQDCNGRSIILRSSGYADFAGRKVPGGRGGVTAVYTIFGNTRQLIIRDPADLSLTGPRCGQSSGGGAAEQMSIGDVRSLFKGATTTAPDRKKIIGTVISDKTAGNTDPKVAVLQEGSAGITVRFRNDHSFALNQQVEVDISGQELSEFKGLLQLNNIDNGRAKALGAGTPVAARKAKISEIIANAEAWESTLVKVANATLPAAAKWDGTLNLSDGSGSLALFTRAGASFAAGAPPAGAADLTGILSQFTDLQLILRNLSDVEPISNSDPELNEPFTSQADDQDVSLPGWTNLIVKGTRKWQAQAFSGNVYAQATAFNDTNSVMETWLITPPVQLSERRLFSFRTSVAFHKHDGLSVWISKDFNGSNFSSATWTQFTGARIATATDGQNTWVNSGDIDLDEYRGKVYIGFKYIGSGSSNTTTYRIDDVRIRKP